MILILIVIIVSFVMASVASLGQRVYAAPVAVTMCGGGLSLPINVGSEGVPKSLTNFDYPRDHQYIANDASTLTIVNEITAMNGYPYTLHNVKGFIAQWTLTRGIDPANPGWLTVDQFSNSGHYAYVNTASPNYSPATSPGQFTDGGLPSYRLYLSASAADATPFQYETVASLGGDASALLSLSSWEVPALTMGDVATGASMSATFYVVTTNGTDGSFTGHGYNFNYSAQLECPTITSAAPVASTQIGATYNTQVSATGITALSYTIGSGSLPTGLTLDETTGVISGIATSAGVYTFSVNAIDTNGNYDQKEYSITIVADDMTPSAPETGEGASVTGVLLTMIAAAVLVGSTLVLARAFKR